MTEARSSPMDPQNVSTCSFVPEMPLRSMEPSHLPLAMMCMVSVPRGMRQWLCLPAEQRPDAHSPQMACDWQGVQRGGPSPPQGVETGMVQRRGRVLRGAVVQGPCVGDLLVLFCFIPALSFLLPPSPLL